MEKHCRICTRYFYGEAAEKVKDDICDYCKARMEKLRKSVPFEISREELEEFVSQEMQGRLERLSPEAWRKAIKEADKRDRGDETQTKD